MKLSKFNIIFKHRNQLYITNTLSKSILQIDEKCEEIIKQNLIDNLTCEEQDILLKRGFLVQDELDEIGLLRYQSNKLKHSKEEMEFVIAPTLSCNFKCSYCFEMPRKGFMSEETQQKVIDFVIKKTRTEENKKIHIIWFGGEPLLYPEIVFSINKRIYDYCKENCKEFKSDMITNGYLLTDEIVKQLSENHINHLQITIDGNKKYHDYRRMLRTGIGTYDTIICNLRKLKNTPITVTIRMNIDKSNVNSIQELEEDIKLLNNPKIICSPAVVELSENHYDDIKEKCIVDHSTFEDYYSNPHIQKYFKCSKGSDFSLRLFFCEAEHAYSFAIDERGNVYKCWNSLGVDKDIYCTIYDETENPNILSTYFSRDPFTEIDCIDCPYIPICAGGCLVQKKLHKNKNFCAESYYNFLKAIKIEIDEKNINK